MSLDHCMTWQPIPTYSGFNSIAIVHASKSVLVEVAVPNQFKCILMSVYSDPQIPLNYIEMFLFQLMLYYTEHARTIVASCSDWPCNPNILLLLTRDFNTEELKSRLKQFLIDKFRLVLATNQLISQLLKITTTDWTFSRDISIACKSYISYYSYHCLAFNKILQISQIVRNK